MRFRLPRPGGALQPVDFSNGLTCSITCWERAQVPPSVLLASYTPIDCWLRIARAAGHDVRVTVAVLRPDPAASTVPDFTIRLRDRFEAGGVHVDHWQTTDELLAAAGVLADILEDEGCMGDDPNPRTLLGWTREGCIPTWHPVTGTPSPGLLTWAAWWVNSGKRRLVVCRPGGWDGVDMAQVRGGDEVAHHVVEWIEVVHNRRISALIDAPQLTRWLALSRYDGRTDTIRLPRQPPAYPLGFLHDVDAAPLDLEEPVFAAVADGLDLALAMAEWRELASEARAGGAGTNAARRLKMIAGFFGLV